MARHYFEATGVLFLECATPVITALFGVYALDKTLPRKGWADFRQTVAIGDPPWSAVRKRLIKLAKSLGCPVPAKGTLSMEDCLGLLSNYFHVKNSDFDEFIREYDAEADVDLDSLFLLATCFDDGHHLTAIKFEGAYYCSPPQKHGFSGYSQYISRHVELYCETGSVLHLGETLHKAMEQDNIDAAVTTLAYRVKDLIRPFRDKALHAALRQKLVAKLLADGP